MPEATDTKLLKFDVLCDECSRLFKEPWETEYPQNLAGLKMDFFKSPHHTAASLRNAAERGCHLCSLFCDKEAGGKLPKEDKRSIAEMTRPRFDEQEHDWHLEVRVGDYSFGRLKLVPLDGR